jgi:hypothetical protein
MTHSAGRALMPHFWLWRWRGGLAMLTAEPLTTPTIIAEVFKRIAQLRTAGLDLIWTEQRNELARLIHGRDLIIVHVQSEMRGAPWS